MPQSISRVFVLYDPVTLTNLNCYSPSNAALGRVDFCRGDSGPDDNSVRPVLFVRKSLSGVVTPKSAVAADEANRLDAHVSCEGVKQRMKNPPSSCGGLYHRIALPV